MYTKVNQLMERKITINLENRINEVLAGRRSVRKEAEERWPSKRIHVDSRMDYGVLTVKAYEVVTEKMEEGVN